MRHPSVLARLRFATLTCVLLAAMAMVSLLIPVTAWGVPLPPDTNEPNDSYGDATRLINGSARYGVVGPETDMDNISMAQMVTMVVRAGVAIGKYAPAPASYVPPFADFGVPHYQFARTGAFNGLFQGYTGPWKWWEPATRGQCAFFVWKMMTAGERPD